MKYNQINFAYVLGKLLDFIYTVCFILMFIPMSDIRKEYNVLYFYMCIIMIMLLSISSFIHNSHRSFKISKKASYILVLWFLIIITLLISSAFNNRLNVIIDYLFIFLFYFMLIPIGKTSINHLSFAICISNLYIAYRCFFELGVTTPFYVGTTINSNQFAIIMIAGCIGAIYLFTKYKNKILKLFSIIVFSISTYLIIISGSRTVLLSLIIVCLMYFEYYVHINEINIIKIKKKLFYIFTTLIIISFFIILKYHNNIYEFFFNKWDNSSNLISGRNEIWINIFKNSNIFYGDTTSTLNANGEMLNWIQQYGIFSFCMHLFFFLYIIRFAFKSYLFYRSTDSLFLLSIVVSYSIIACFENMFTVFGKPLNFFCLFTIGYLIKNSKL